jgi:DNA modification methylase
VRSFQDRWAGGVDHYIAWLKERVEEMYRLLKPTGSIFLHCDWHANAYIRVYILDKLFGGSNFRSEIIWKRTSAHNSAKGFGPIHDTIFHYSKSSVFTWNAVSEKLNEEYVEKFYRHEDERGRFQAVDLTADGVRNGTSGKPWRGIDPTSVGRHWAIPQKQLKKLFPNKDFSDLETQAALDFLEEQDLIVWPQNGAKPRFKKYLHLTEGQPAQDLILDIRPVASQSKERIGYPTQKPLALMERIVSAASNEGDWVLDPFMGGGTTIIAAEQLGRNWVGIDQSVQAVKVTDLRLQQMANLFSSVYAVQLHKYAYEDLLNRNPFEFERWIVEQYGGEPNLSQRGDKGIDGRTREGLPIQVKQSEAVGRNVVDNFLSAAERFDAKRFAKQKAAGQPVGVIIAFSFNKGAVQEVARLRNEAHVQIELVEVGSIVPLAKKPMLAVEFEPLGINKKGEHEIAFRAKAQSDVGIEFFSWQWNFVTGERFQADVLFDKTGEQVVTLAPGSYNVAVKAVDNDGLDIVETLRLQVNGGISKR